MPRTGRRPEEGGESKTKDSWCTPGPVVAALRKFTGGKQIELDPCSNPGSHVDAKVEWYGPAEGGTDGLITPWLVPPDSLIYVNPPYSEKFL
ncbi:MAG: hypothetical protein ACYSVY_21765, partial [Planctomycetota bacterium]